MLTSLRSGYNAVRQMSTVPSLMHINIDSSVVIKKMCFYVFIN